MRKERLDVLLVARGMAESRSLAQRLVMAGQVRVNGQVTSRVALRIDITSELSIDQPPRFVSRGGEKLEAALYSFGFSDLQRITCADVGASTGGFSDCLLQHGAGKVYAIDVGYGELHWKLRNNPRVVVMERTNARLVQKLPEAIHLVTIDASFISLKILLPVVKNWLDPQLGKVIALVKPQFEAGRVDAAKGEGVIRDPEIHRRVLTEIIQSAQTNQFFIGGLIRSPLTGPKGNVEFLIYLSLVGRAFMDTGKLVDALTGLPELPRL